MTVAGSPSPSPSRTSAPPWRILAVVGVVVGLIAVAFVVRSSPSHPFGNTPASTRSVGPSGPTHRSVDPTGTRPPPDAGGTSRTDGLITLGVIVVALAVLGLLAWLAMRYGRRLRAVPSLGGLNEIERERPAPGAPAVVSDAVHESATHLIDRGPVADAIVTCWLRVGDALAEAGTVAAPTETSTEFVDRVLRAFGADEAALRTLAALYREARFSEHAMGEHDRSAARASLSAIRDDLTGGRRG